MKETIDITISKILQENERRRAIVFAPFNPITGEGSIGQRVAFTISDYPIPTQYLPVEMMDEPFVKSLSKAGSVDAFIRDALMLPVTDEARDKVVEEFIRIRQKHDYPFWAAMFAYIKRKGGGTDVLFRLNRPQRKLIKRLEKMRKAGKPIRLILLKARQWGGSTAIQIYMAWLQLVHEVGLNSLIIAHQGTGSDEIKDMFDRMIKSYPVEMLHELGDAYAPNEPKMVGVGKSGNIFRVPQRNCKIKIGTAERPNSCRGGDYNLVHLSEVALWKETDGKKPEDIVRSACSGILLRPYTMIVYESTPNGVGNFFHKEHLAAKKGLSQFEAMFVAWFEIEQYELPFANEAEKYAFAKKLFENRRNDEVKSDREEPGTYLWRLWEKGATLEAIHWYVSERSKYTNHGDMASEYPSDDIEAFTYSGRKVFSSEDVEQFRPACRAPRWIGEIYGSADEGEKAIEGLRFKKEADGRLFMWHDVERSDIEEVTDRYLVVVDVCKGHTKNADFADILVIDRLFMMDGEPPVVAAEWHGHIDMDKLAWKATQVAAYYNNALLVIESNTLETNNTKGEAEYILTLIHEVYGKQLYARKQSAEDIRQGLPKKYGYHTNPLTKKVVIYNLKVVIRERLYIEREEACLDEYLTYVETENNVFEAMEGYHDDRLMTRAIGMQVCYHEMELPRIVKKINNINAGLVQVPVSAATIG
ncbi:MAG: terminase [Prevotellaceae bacterium]|nr:terminase [Prevotellaceae bacterium]